VASLGGRGFYDYTESPASPVMIRREVLWTHIYDRLHLHYYRFSPSYDLTHFRYVILHSSDDTLARVVMLALQPEARFVFHQGEWTVLESTLPLVPIDSPDEPLPTPHPATLRQRALDMLHALRKKPGADDPLPPDPEPDPDPPPGQ
jgi:hypothetical protein